MARHNATVPVAVGMAPAGRGVFGLWLMRIRWTIAGFTLGFGAALGAGLGRGERGPAQELGEVLDRASHEALHWFSGAAGTVGGHLGGGHLGGGGLADQVSDRLERDKNLDAAGVTVEIEGEGEIVLRGLVADDASKERAVVLARDTRGVRQVTDHLAVKPRPRVVAAPPEEGEGATDDAPPTGLAERPRVIQAKQPRLFR